MNLAIIFAGGVGSRFKMSDLPKQFQKVNDKEILIHTLEKFEYTKEIDSIILVIVEGWLSFTKKLIKSYNLKKVDFIITGGSSGQESIYLGVKCAKENYPSDSIVLIHDGVRPIIDTDLIVKNIDSVKENGNGITVSRAIETVIALEEGTIKEVYDRKNCWHAKAPQSFILKDIFNAHIRAIEEKKFDFIDSANLMYYYDHNLHIVEGDDTNIKVTTNKDYHILKSHLKLMEVEQEHD